jgi:Holliday junction resolvasome RuvABC endonuclease subunit
MRILGLDASSTTIGISLLSTKDGKVTLEHQEFYKPPKEGSIFERLSATKSFIKQKLEQLKPDEIVIEEIIQFLKGGSGAKTIILLAVFNRTVGLTCYEYLGKEPIMMNVMRIRHKLKFDKKFPAKEDMPEIVAKHLNIDFPYYYAQDKKGNAKLDKKTGKNKVMIENFDVADSIAVGLAYILVEKEKASKQCK